MSAAMLNLIGNHYISQIEPEGSASSSSKLEAPSSARESSSEDRSCTEYPFCRSLMNQRLFSNAYLDLTSSITKYCLRKSLKQTICIWDLHDLKGKKMLRFENEDFDLFVYGFPNGKVKMELCFLPGDQLLIDKLIKAELSDEMIQKADLTGSLMLTEHSDFKRIDWILTIYYNVEDSDSIFQRVVKYGTSHFPELQLHFNNWYGFTPNEYVPKTLIFFCLDFQLYIFGFSDGTVKFQISNLRPDSRVFRLLEQSGIDVQKIQNHTFNSFETDNCNDLKKIYNMLSLYYPFSEQDFLVKNLAEFGNWKLQEVAHEISVRSCTSLKG